MDPQPTPLYGLVLAGGRSTRMGEDKGLITYTGGRPQREMALELLAGVCSRAFLSLAEPAPDCTFDCIIDELPGAGPLIAILSAFNAFPQVAWLVAACDLPHLDSAALRHLIKSRAPGSDATAFRSTALRGPEPLCAIYEPHVAPALADASRRGVRSPRKLLETLNVHLVTPPDEKALRNANTPADRDDVRVTKLYD